MTRKLLSRFFAAVLATGFLMSGFLVVSASSATAKKSEKPKVTEQAVYESDGKLYYTNTWKYDEQGNVTEQSHINRGGNVRTTATKYKYGKNGNMLEESFYNADGVITRKNIYKYDKTGNVAEKLMCSGGFNALFGIAAETIKYSYDTNGNLTESSGHSRTGKYFTDKYKYDASGNLTEAVSYNGKDELSVKYTYKYDKNGNKTEEIKYNRGGFVVSHSYKYDENGNLTEDKNKGVVEIVDDGEYPGNDGTVKYKYDKNGNKTEAVFYDAGGKVWSRDVFKYDTAGNLTEYIEYYGGKLLRTTKYKYDV